MLQKQSTILLPKHKVANYSDGLNIKTAVSNNCLMVWHAWDDMDTFDYVGQVGEKQI